MDLKKKRIAIVCDWISDWGGAELVLEQMMEVFPNADIYTSVFWQHKNPLFRRHLSSEFPEKIHTSFIQKIPILNKSHKLALMLRPQAFESFDFSEYDIVISSTSAESKGIVTKPDTLHICYCHTPTRYFWSHYHEYLKMMEFGVLNHLGKYLMPKIVNKLRSWDFCAAQRPDVFLANSKNTQNRIKKYYGRKSDVVYPGIDTEAFRIGKKSGDFYLSAGRCIPYKKFDLLVEAFNQSGKPLVLVTNTDNTLYKKLKSISKENITWKLGISNSELRELYTQAKGFVFPPEEDFGLVPLEAMASGTPVIAFKKGGALETVVEGVSGVFFEEQTPESLNEAIDEFETMTFEKKKIKKYAQKFDTSIFQKNLIKAIESSLRSK